MLVEPGFSARQGQSWSWQPLAAPPPEAVDPRVDNDIVRGAIERAVRAAMSARGFIEVADPQRAELLLSFRVGLTRRTELRETLAPSPVRQRVVCGPRGCIPVLDVWAWHGPPALSVRSVEYLEGGLMLDVLDAASGRLGWRGTIEERVQRGGMPPQTEIDAAVLRLIERIPLAP